MLAAALGCALPAVGEDSLRKLELADFGRIQSVDGPSCSHDGNWIAYAVTGSDHDADELRTSIWMVNWAGTEHVRLTAATESSRRPLLSPDGRFVAFLSARGGAAQEQIYLLDRHGGEAKALTAVSGEIQDFAWSPDGKRMVVAMAMGNNAQEGHAGAPAASRDAEGGKAAKPIVIDRLRFKQDEHGYLGVGNRIQLFLLDVQSHALEKLSGDARFDDENPAWSPDGALIAFTSGRETNPDESDIQELYVVEPKVGATPRRLAKLYVPTRQELMWMPDSRQIVYTIGLDPKVDQFKQDRMAVVSVAEGPPRVLADRLDRPLSNPVHTAAGGVVGVLIADDRSQYPATLKLDGTTPPRRSYPAPVRVTEQCAGGHRTVLAASSDTLAPELYALEEGRLRKLTGHNDEFMAQVQWGAVEDISFTGADGDEVHGLVVKPPGFEAGHRYPTIVWLHGGPTEQDEHGLAFDTWPLQFERQWLAAHGYVVLAINYHGSSGRGIKYATSIAGDWGNKEVIDVLAGANWAVDAKIADPERLGIGGWSYGGILTDYVIASDTRFKAAVSGAGSGNQLAMYGTDEYIVDYNAELTPPWKAPDRWLKVSYPFFHADRIKTPTLFLGGDRDFNVPVAGSEQMYQALRTLGVATQLVIYPEQSHLLTRPSFIRDRAQRNLEWFDRHLKAARADAQKSEAAKADASPKDDGAKPDSGPKGDAPKADAAKGDAPKGDAPKAEAGKADGGAKSAPAK